MSPSAADHVGFIGQIAPRLHNTTICVNYMNVLAVSSHDGAVLLALALALALGARLHPPAGGQHLRVHPRLPTMGWREGARRAGGVNDEEGEARTAGGRP